MTKQFLKLYIALLSIFSFCIWAIPSYVSAETHITDDTSFDHGAFWVSTGSPYVLDSDVYIPEGQTLYIGPGVTVTTSASNPGSIVVRGTVTIDGTTSKPVNIHHLSLFSIYYSTSTISNAIIDIPAGLQVIKSTISISSTTIENAGKGIAPESSTVSILNSVISGNVYGIYSAPLPPPVFEVMNIFRPASVYAQTTSDNPNENHITISSSSILNNTSYGIYNSVGNVVNAENNWWGSNAGPGGMVSGNVGYTPWLMKDPDVQQPVCCSNVLFLPGLEASRLYLDEKLSFGHATSTNQLWEPNRNDDVRKLFMTSSGQSINSGIYTKDIIDKALGLIPVYGAFMDMMNGAVTAKIMNSWLPYPYDWRFDVGTVVTNKLISAIESLASTSKTGKVSIVAHSNGGLVAKLLGKALADKGEGSLLDKVILVAVPQLGTPQAIGALLHGDNEALLGGAITSQSVARQLGENMPGAYGLIPSRNYFSQLSIARTPIISFASSTLINFGFKADDNQISTYDTLRSFLSGNADRRTEPDSDIINVPGVLHPSMIDTAQKIHTSIDNFSFASTTRVIALAGWGEPTVSGLSYYEKNLCSENAMTMPVGVSPSCTKTLEHSASTTVFGDGTVVMQSALASTSDAANYYFDLDSENKGRLITDGHASILSTNSVVAFMKEELASSSVSTLPPYISDKAPTMADYHADDLVVSVHSPVELNMYDGQGNHTGPIPNPDPTSDLGRYETNIPGSTYVPNEGDTYIRVPYGTNYKVTFTGTGMGSFEVDTEHDLNGIDIANTTFADMPVTPLLKAELALATTTSATIAATTATASQMILFDFNGDGTVDATTTPHDQYDPVLDAESYQTIISSLNLSPAREKIMHDKLAFIIDCLRKKKSLKPASKPNTQEIVTARQAMKDLQNQHWIFKNLDPVRKQQLEDIFQAFLDQINSSQ